MVKSVGVTVTGAQLRAARALLNMRAEDLANESKVSLRTIRRAEIDDGPLKMTAANASAILTAFMEHGITFIENRESLGVTASRKCKRT